MKIPKRLNQGGCGGWFCIFCWLEERHQKKMLKDGYWPRVNKK